MNWNGDIVIGDNETGDRLFRFDSEFVPRGELALPETIDDIEALASSPAGLWVIGSQSANKEAKVRPMRERIGLLGATSGMSGPLIPDFTACAPCVEGRGRAPNRGGFNVEGAAWFDGALWLGLRAPLQDGKALLVRMDGNKAVATVTVDLGGMAVREMVPWRDGLLYIAGPVDDTQAPHQLWWSATPGAAARRLTPDLPPRAEGILVTDDGTALYVVDGDGKAGTTCVEPARWGRVQIGGM